MEYGGMGYYGGFAAAMPPYLEESADLHHQHAKRQRTDGGAAAAAGYEREGQDPERTVRGGSPRRFPEILTKRLLSSPDAAGAPSHVAALDAASGRRPEPPSAGVCPDRLFVFFPV